MMKIIRSQDRHRFQSGWLDTRWSFSFDRYYDPENMSFGALRVFNDDWIQPGGGFPPHQHNDMEIVTYVIEGELEHTDSTGGGMIIKAGDVQVMSAGSGIIHSEMNPSEDTPVHLLQIWIKTDMPGHKPRYDQRSYKADDMKGRLLPVAGENSPLHINRDATVYLSRLGTGGVLGHPLGDKRGAHLFVVSGGLAVNGQTLEEGDAARITGQTSVKMEAPGAVELMLIDVPYPG